MIISAETHNELLIELKTFRFHDTPEKLIEFLHTNETDPGHFKGVQQMLNFAIEAERYDMAKVIHEYLKDNGRQCS